MLCYDTYNNQRYISSVTNMDRKSRDRELFIIGKKVNSFIV